MASNCGQPAKEALMSNDSIAGDKSVREQCMTDALFDPSTMVSLADVFRIITSQLLAFFQSRGCEARVADALTQTAMRELTVSVPAFLRRTRTRNVPEPVVIQVENLTLDLERRRLWRGNEEVHLSPKEFELLAFMMKNAGVSLTHMKLLRSFGALSTEASWNTYAHTYAC
jgi:hypothetical protein